MSHVIKTLQIALLFLGASVILATSRAPDSVEISDEWIISNRFHGETGVNVNDDIELAIGYQDFESETDSAGARTRRALESIILYPEDNPDEKVAMDLDIQEADTILQIQQLDPDTRYVLDVRGIEQHLLSQRTIPSPITFSTMSAPTVTGIFKNNDTLFITFSEPMDPDTLYLGHDSIDIFWQEEETLFSIVYDLNLADFTHEGDEWMFKVAPVDFLENVWVKVSGNVQAETGIYLDGNQNQVPEEEGDDFIQAVNIADLDTCFSREDIPNPCIAEDDIPSTIETRDNDWNDDDWDDDWDTDEW